MRQPNEKRFVLKDVRPWEDGTAAITKEAFEDLVNISGDDIPRPSEEQMLVYTLPRLKEIAAGPDAEARQWLKEVVDSCKDTPEKRELEAILKSKSQ